MVSERQFQKLLQPKLGESYERALTLFRGYAPNRSFDVTNVLHLATKQEQGKVDRVLAILEEHFDNHVGYQDPEIRGSVRDNLLNVNPTDQMFLRICEITLGLQPNSK